MPCLRHDLALPAFHQHFLAQANSIVHAHADELLADLLRELHGLHNGMQGGTRGGKDGLHAPLLELVHPRLQPLLGLNI